MRGSLAIAAGLQTGAVFLGYFWGLAIYPGHATSMYASFALLALLLMVVGAFLAAGHHRVADAKYCDAVCVAALLYSVGVVWGEPFFRVGNYEQIVGVALVLAPLLLAIEYLTRGEAWVSVAGVTLFVFISSAMIASNASNGVVGSGFFSSWVA